MTDICENRDLILNVQYTVRISLGIEDIMYSLWNKTKSVSDYLLFDDLTRWIVIRIMTRLIDHREWHPKVRVSYLAVLRNFVAIILKREFEYIYNTVFESSDYPHPIDVSTRRIIGDIVAHLLAEHKYEYEYEYECECECECENVKRRMYVSSSEIKKICLNLGVTKNRTCITESDEYLVRFKLDDRAIVQKTEECTDSAT